MIKYVILILYFINKTKNDYFFALKNPQNFMKDTNYGIMGGTIGSYLSLINSFSISFWFKFNNFINNTFPFITFYKEKNILKEYNFYKNTGSISSFDEKSKNIFIQKNITYFIKLEFLINSNNNINIKLIVFTDLSNFSMMESSYSSNVNINDIIFIINRYNLSEDLLIENLVYYNCNNCYTNNEIINGVSNIFYFINFRNNYPNSKWLMNEIENEFGPSLNGVDNNFSNMFNAVFDEINKEIIWESSNNFNEITFNPTIMAYIDEFRLNLTLSIFLKFDLFLNHLSTFSENEYNFDILNFYNNKIRVQILVDNPSKNLEINFYFVNIDDIKTLIFTKDIPNPTLISSKNFIDGNYFGLKFLAINLNRIFNSNYIINNYVLLKNSIFCTNLSIACFFEKTINHTNMNFTKNLTINLNNDLTNKLILALILKEFILGNGNLDINFDSSTENIKIINKNIINPFLIYDNNFENIERRNNFNEEENHSNCSISNCSICRNDLNICEFCYNNYYLSSGSCLENIYSYKFVNKYSLFKNIRFRTDTSYSNEIFSSLSYKKYEYYYSISSINIFSVIIDLNSATINNILYNIVLKNCNINLFYNKLENRKGNLNLTFIINNDCINEILLYSYNSNSIFNNIDIISKTDTINCNSNFRDLPCNIGCSRNDQYFTKFDDTLYYSKCENSEFDYYTKNKGFFKYYSKCPYNCKKCNINSNDIFNCIECEQGYILKNNECILKIMINCNIESNFSISNNNSKLNLNTCNNICNFIENNNNNNEIDNLIRVYNNTKNCNNNDEIVLKCKNNWVKFYNFNDNKCINCVDNNCIKFICDNCNSTNNFYPCSNNYIFKNFLCIFNEYFEQNCKKYDYNIYIKYNVCKVCNQDYYLNYDDYKCYKRVEINCLTFYENSHFCKICKNGYFISYLKTCIKCNEDCFNCQYNSNNCISCKFGYELKINKCFLKEIHKKNCKTFNYNNFCLICDDGFFLNNALICENCDQNCLRCSSKNVCSFCKTGYLLINNNCEKKISNCKILNKNNQLNCDKCKQSFYLTKNLKCIKCDLNCLNCKNNSLNCVSCKKNGILINHNNTNICEYKCKNEFYFFDIVKKKCTKCEISKYKELKLYENSTNFNINELNNFTKDQNLSEYKYFLIIDIPEFINESNLDIKNFKRYFKFVSKKVNLNLKSKIFLNVNNKKILIIPIINTFLKVINIELIVSNELFNKYEKCIFKNKIIDLNIINYNYNKTVYENELDEKLDEEFKTYKKSSEDYKNIDDVYQVTKIITNSLFFGNIFLSIFSPGILTKLTVFLPQLLYFNFLILLKIDYGEKINTILSLINFNPKLINIADYINLNENIIFNKITSLYVMNLRFKLLKLFNFSFMTMNFLIINCLLLLIIIVFLLKTLFKFIKYIIFKIFVLLKSYKFNFKDIMVNNFKIKLKKNFIMIEKLFSFLNDKLFLYYLGFLISDIPNIILVSLIYYSSFNINIFSFTSIFIYFILIFNAITLVFVINYNIFLISYFKVLLFSKKFLVYKKITNFFVPFKTKNENKYLNYFKIVENIRLISSLLIILFLNYNIYFQIIIIIFIQTIYIVILGRSLQKNVFLIILFIKEIFIFIFWFLIFYLKMSSWNYSIEYIIIINIIIIIILSVIELAYTNLRVVFQLIYLLYLKWKKIYLSKKNKKKLNNILKNKKKRNKNKIYPEDIKIKKSGIKNYKNKKIKSDQVIIHN